MSVVDPATVLFLTAAATAAFGTVVAGLAYRGGRRNDSDAMRWLAVGVVFIAVVPFGVNYLLAPFVGLSDAGTLLGVLLSFNAGLVAILYSLEGT
jgi:hypothetical protein